MKEKKRLSKSLVAIGVLFILLPMLFCFTPISIFQPTAPPWHADLEPTIDTYVSSNDSLDHSSETIFKVGKYSDNGEQITEIGLLWLVMAPPPGPIGSLTDMTINLHCTDVKRPGAVRIHRLQENESWNVDLSELNFTKMPEYDFEYFSILEVDSEGEYTVDLLVVGGFSGYSVGGIAVIADPGVQVIFSTSESEDETSRPLVRLSGEGSSGIWFNPLKQPWMCYSNPLSWVPLIIGFTILAYVSWTSLKSKARKTKAPF